MSDLQTRCEIPEGSIILSTIDMVTYIDPDGEIRRNYAVGGDARISQLVYLIEWTKHYMMRCLDED